MEPDGAHRGGEHVRGEAQPAQVAAVLRPDEGGVEPQHGGEVRRATVRRRGREPVREEAAGERGELARGDAVFPLGPIA